MQYSSSDCWQPRSGIHWRLHSLVTFLVHVAHRHVTSTNGIKPESDVPVGGRFVDSVQEALRLTHVKGT